MCQTPKQEFTGCRINNGQMVIFVTSGNNEKVDVMKCSICGKKTSVPGVNHSLVSTPGAQEYTH